MILFFFLSYKGENQSFGQGPVARQQGKILACQDTCSKTFSLSSVPFHAMWKPRNCIAFGGKKTPLVYLLHEEGVVVWQQSNFFNESINIIENFLAEHAKQVFYQ